MNIVFAFLVMLPIFDNDDVNFHLVRGYVIRTQTGNNTCYVKGVQTVVHIDI